MNAREVCDLTYSWMLSQIQTQDDLTAFQQELEDPVEFAWCGLILASDDTFMDTKIRKEDRGIVLKKPKQPPKPWSAMLGDDK